MKLQGFTLFIYRIVRPFLTSLRTNPFYIRYLFGVKIPPGVSVHYDTTTVLMRRALVREIGADTRVLEVGIGTAALLSLYAAKKTGIKPHGTDISQSRVDTSLKVAAFNDVDADFITSDLFDSVRGTFDVIFFNPPYVPAEFGKKLNLTEKLKSGSDSPWNGGSDGTDTIERFLSGAHDFLDAKGRIVMGVQDFYVNKHTINMMARVAGLKVKATVKKPLNPSTVYVLLQNRLR